MTKYAFWSTPETATDARGWAMAVPIEDALAMGYRPFTSRRVQGEIFCIIIFPSRAYCRAVALRAGYFAVELDEDPKGA